MKSLSLLITLFLIAPATFAAIIPAFSATISNYGNQSLQNTTLVLEYRASSGLDGSCPSCYRETVILPVTNIPGSVDGIVHFPKIKLDPKNTRHSFTLRVNHPLDRWGNAVVYFCDVLQSSRLQDSRLQDDPSRNFVPCENVLQKDLQTLSAYSFGDQKLNLELTSGESTQQWITKIGNMYLRVHVGDVASYYGEPLGWSKQVFGTCDKKSCQIQKGVILFVGKDLGPNPELFYNIEATEQPDFSSTIKGIHGFSFSEIWNRELPSQLTNFTVVD